MRRRIVLIGTSGTIASRYDPALGRTVASQRGEDLLAQVPFAELAPSKQSDPRLTPAPCLLTVRMQGGAMQPTSRITSKGQTTIPREVRQKLSLQAGRRARVRVRR